MYLSKLARTIATNLNTQPSSSWKTDGYSIPTTTQAKFALDPFRQELPGVNVFVIPDFIEYNLETRRTNSPPRRKYVTVALIARVSAEDGTPDYDVTTQASAQKLIDFKEDIDNILVNMKIDGRLPLEMEVEPIDSLKIQEAYFVTTTMLGYNIC